MDINKARILIVDDDEDLLFLLSHQLKIIGFLPEVCVNGQNFFDIVEKFSPAVICLDISMSHADGTNLCNAIKHDSRWSSIKILIISGNRDIGAIAKNCGADGFLPKPVAIPALKNKLDEILQ
jgi:DNA-binding response OmpR family regulator